MLSASMRDLRAVGLLSAGVVLLKAVFIWLTPIRHLGMTAWIIDDAFITMQVARNIALGHGFSFDGLYPTTGVAPLWTYLTSLGFLAGDAWGIRLTLLACAVSGAVVGMMSFRLGQQLTGKRSTAWLAFILTSLTANAFLGSLNGMETALQAALLLGAASLWMDAVSHDQWSRKGAGVIGVLLGLAIMVRIDSVFFATGMILTTVLCSGRRMNRTQGTSLLWLCATCGMGFVLLCMWSWVQSGSPIPTNQAGRHALALALHGYPTGHVPLLARLRISGWNVFQWEQIVTIATGSSLLGLAALGLSATQPRMKPFVGLTCIYLLLFWGMLIGYQWYFSDFHGLRYAYTGCALLLIFMAALLTAFPLVRLQRSIPWLLVAWIVVMTWYGERRLLQQTKWAAGMTVTGRVSQAQERAFWSQIDWLRAHMPPQSIIGARDHGRLAFFSGYPIQDLAGIIDNHVLEHVQDGTIGPYLRSRGVTHLIIPSSNQRQDYLYQVLRSQLKLTPVSEAADTSTTTLYSIEWNTPKPPAAK